MSNERENNMESNEVKRFKTKVNKIVHNFDSLVFFSFVTMLIVNIIITCLIGCFIQNKIIIALCAILSVTMPFVGAMFLFNEHDAEETEKGCKNNE